MSLKIYLIGRPQFDTDTFISFLRNQEMSWRRSEGTKPPEELVEVAGRMCYLSFGKNQSELTNSEFIRDCIRNGHESILEHVNWTFVVTGISRALTHQLVRHRIGFSYSQLSQQYHDETNAGFIEPSQLKNSPNLHAIWEDAVRTARDAYCRIKQSLDKLAEVRGQRAQTKEFGWAVRSIARSVLPNSTETKIVVTANARAFRHFLSLRGSASNDEEMRYLAANILEHLKVEAPALFFDFRIEPLPDESPTVVQTDNC